MHGFVSKNILQNRSLADAGSLMTLAKRPRRLEERDRNVWWLMRRECGGTNG